MRISVARHAGTALVLLLGVWLLGGCGESYDELPSDAPKPMHLPTPSPSASSSAPVDPGSSSAPTSVATPPPVAASCPELLTGPEAAALAGVRVSAPVQTPGMPMLTCRWSAGGGTQLVAMEGTMEEWKQFVPPAVLDAARRVVRLSGDECEWFTAMSGALNGSPDPGPHQVVVYVPDDGQPRSVSAQQCRRGLFSMLQLTSPRLERGPALDRRLSAGLAALAD